MEKRDAILCLLLLGGGGYAVYANWDTISAKLGLAEYNPGRIKAIELARQEMNFELGVTNWQWLESRQQLGEIQFEGDPWQAEAIGGQEYRVTVRWIEAGAHVAHGFRVNIATRTIVHDGPIGEPAAPR